MAVRTRTLLLATIFGWLLLAGTAVNLRPAAAAPASAIAITQQSCISAEQIRLVITWQPSGDGLQWVDLSLFNNNFAPNSFIGLGPFPAGENTLVWDGLLDALPHYLRINTLTPGGWQPSQTIAFTTPNCGFFNSAASSVGVAAQSCMADGSVRVDLGWTPSQQGTQWVDLSLFNNGFAPGTFLGAGPLPPQHGSLTWQGLLPAARHYLRVNTFTGAGWFPSQTISFQTLPCVPGYGTLPVTIDGPANGITILTDVRVGAHPAEGFDRIVFEFVGQLPDESTVQYRPSAVQCGSGMTEDVLGAGTLSVLMRSTQAHDEQGQLTIDTTAVNGTGGAILEGVQTCDFEGIVEWAIGTPDARPFRVTTLSNPPRLVVDVVR